MTLKTIFVACILAIAPLSSFAMCSKGYHDMTANSCAEGQMWDQEAQACVDLVTG